LRKQEEGAESLDTQEEKPKRKNRLINLRDTNARVLLLMAVPCVILLLAFQFVPIFGWAYAFFRYKPGTPLFKSEFVGLANFIRMFSGANVEILMVLKNTFVFSFLGLILSPLPMVFAIVMSEIKWPRFQKLIQDTITFPNFISMIIIYSFCMVLFSFDDGIINNLFLRVGLISERKSFLTDEGIVYFLQTFLTIWKNVGFTTVIYFAAIAGIDPELYDAAAVDGANFFQRMRHIKVPGLLPTFLVLLLLSIGNMLNNGFEQFYVFYNANVHNKIQVLDLYVYKIGMERGNYSLSTAVGIFKTFVSVALLFSANFISKKIVGRAIL
jgi:ABC-type polysaccharide transport system permease subunit